MNQINMAVLLMRGGEHIVIDRVQSVELVRIGTDGELRLTIVRSVHGPKNRYAYDMRRVAKLDLIRDPGEHFMPQERV